MLTFLVRRGRILSLLSSVGWWPGVTLFVSVLQLDGLGAMSFRDSSISRSLVTGRPGG